MEYKAIFNNYNLSDGTNYRVEKIDVKMPKSNVSKYELVKSDGQIVTSKYYGERIITVKGSIIALDLDSMNTKLDNLKIYIDGYGKNLDITTGTTTKRYVATAESFNYSTQGYFCEWEISFTCDAIGIDTGSTALTFGTYTASNTSYTNTIGGTYKTSPYIDFIVNRVLPYWSNKYIQVNNAVTNQTVRMIREWHDGERVIINGLNKTVSIYPVANTTIDSCDSATGWTSAHTLSLNQVLMQQGTGCLSIVMSGTATNTSYNRLNVATGDLSSTAGTVYFMIFIPTLLSGTITQVRLLTGSDATLASNYCQWNLTTQADGSAIAYNAWNYFKVNLSTSPDSTTGSPNRSAILSMSIVLYNGTSMQLSGALLDFICLQKASVISQPLDYEGTFTDLLIGSSSLIFTDELTTKNITITGYYYKRYI